jgi:hypothetical protein
LNEAVDLELDEHAEAGVTLVEELLTDFLQVNIFNIKSPRTQLLNLLDFRLGVEGNNVYYVSKLEIVLLYGQMIFLSIRKKIDE